MEGTDPRMGAGGAGWSGVGRWSPVERSLLGSSDTRIIHHVRGEKKKGEKEKKRGKERETFPFSPLSGRRTIRNLFLRSGCESKSQEAKISHRKAFRETMRTRQIMDPCKENEDRPSSLNNARDDEEHRTFLPCSLADSYSRSPPSDSRSPPSDSHFLIRREMTPVSGREDGLPSR